MRRALAAYRGNYGSQIKDPGKVSFHIPYSLSLSLFKALWEKIRSSTKVKVGKDRGVSLSFYKAFGGKIGSCKKGKVGKVNFHIPYIPCIFPIFSHRLFGGR